MPEGSLKCRKADISRLIDEFLDDEGGSDGATTTAKAEAEGEDEAEEEEEVEVEVEEKAPKKKKTRATKEEYAPVEPKPEKNHSLITVNGEEAPKDLKSKQTKLKISGAKFLSRAPEIKIDIQGNILSGKPREFSSGARGWYLGGKIPLKVDGMTIWAQAGINIVIPGSNEWK